MSEKKACIEDFVVPPSETGPAPLMAIPEAPEPVPTMTRPALSASAGLEGAAHASPQLTSEGECASDVVLEPEPEEIDIRSLSPLAQELFTHLMAALAAAVDAHEEADEAPVAVEGQGMDAEDAGEHNRTASATLEGMNAPDGSGADEEACSADSSDALSDDLSDDLSEEWESVPVASLDAVLRFQNLLETPSPRGELARLIKRMVETRRGEQRQAFEQAMSDFQETSTFLELATQHDDERSPAQRRAEARRMMDNMIWRVDFGNA